MKFNEFIANKQTLQSQTPQQPQGSMQQPQMTQQSQTSMRQPQTPQRQTPMPNPPRLPMDNVEEYNNYIKSVIDVAKNNTQTEEEAANLVSRTLDQMVNNQGAQ